MQTENLIIGGGISGLYLAYKLAQQKKDFLLLEARDRLGGRIDNHQGLDLGPTWFWPGQHRMAGLAQELDIPIFEQQTHGDMLYEDPNVQSERIPSQQHQMISFRAEGGISRFIQGLVDKIPSDKIFLNHKVAALSKTDDGVSVDFSQGSTNTPITAKQIFLALPPRLIARNMTFTPVLCEKVEKSMLSIPTWMAGQAKAIIQFDTPFWQDQSLSGQAYSRLGPLMEIHDASASSDAPFALFGFIGGTSKLRKEMGEEQLKAAITQQIIRLFGAKASTPLTVKIKDWSSDNLTSTKDDMESLSTHPTYGLPKAMTNLWDGQIIFTGTEVASSEGGYLEGALVAAEDAILCMKNST